MTLSLKAKKKMRQAQLAAYQRLGIASVGIPFENIYYCCTQKTASQWFKGVFSDPTFYRYTGFSVAPHPATGGNEVESIYAQPFPKQTIATHLYIPYEVYEKIPKPQSYRTFFLLRDPRDILVSWYFSTLYSHYPFPKVVERRLKLQSMGLEEGLIFSIDELTDSGLFDIQRSWAEAQKRDFEIFRYEDFATDNVAFLRHLLQFIETSIPDHAFEKLCKRHRFTEYAGNRDQGVGDHRSHYRKGVAGDWMNYFDQTVEAHFERRTGNLLDVLGYTKANQLNVGLLNRAAG